ncbi:hypothetical protein CTAYLR_003849 [Chrysophaeum taylorii]|uniref:Flavoprotein domain-containing protein n=1 Tax=Chrysophaeum taylorii TaxID=2483200 RepID=A0AAD7UG91_9STRA|nr:hypothetical protein CTAYLR_003849 [Chrysophaeum taylorii]
MQAAEMEERLLDVEESSSERRSGESLARHAREALGNPRVREMLEAFRRGGPGELRQFVGDPEFSKSLEALRGPAREIPRPTKRVLVGVTGSVAATKVPELCSLLEAAGHETRVIATPRGAFFLKDVDYLSDEWTKWVKGDPVLHIELRKWADVLVIAPLSANAMAKLALGLCDDLVTCVARAWDFSKPLVVAPAMNTAMWTHPVTSAHLLTLKKWGVRVVDPVVKTLACGDTGIGALAPPTEILAALLL